MKMLPELNDPRVALVLSPQSFHNYNPKSDIFNHSNFTYWEYILPGQPASLWKTKLQLMDLTLPGRAAAYSEVHASRAHHLLLHAQWLRCAVQGPGLVYCCAACWGHMLSGQSTLLWWPLWLPAGPGTLQGIPALPG